MLLLQILISHFVFAQSHCRDLSKKQAETAARIVKTSVYQGASVHFHSKREGGLVKPQAIWLEKNKKSKKYRFVMDGRQYDLSVLYVARDKSQQRAFNLAWLSGCRAKYDKPMSIPNKF